MKLLRSSDDTPLAISDFLDSKSPLIQRIRRSRTLPEVDGLIDAINSFLSQATSHSHKTAAKRVRQKAYDKRRALKKIGEQQMPTRNVSQLPSAALLELEERLLSRIEEKFEEMKMVERDAGLDLKPSPEDGQRPSTFSAQIKEIGRTLAERALRLLPLGGLLLPPIIALGYLLVSQMVPLYEASGFPNAATAAIGAAGMVLGFTAIGALSKSFWAKCFLFLAIVYEGVFMLSGTREELATEQARALQQDPKLIYLAEMRDQAKLKLDAVQGRYTDPEDKIFGNQWFYGKYVVPAQTSHNQASEDYLQAREAAIDRQSEVLGLSFNAWMKLSFRLGLVVLNVMLCHIFLVRAKELATAPPSHAARARSSSFHLRPSCA